MNIYDQLRRDEGVEHEMYLDSEGFLSIGVGHNLRARGISDAAVDQILRDDVAEITQELMDTHPWVVALSSARFGAAQNLAFNLGVEGFGGFKKMIAAMQRQDWAEASKQVLNSRYATQVGDRAKRVAEQILTGRWV